MRRRAICAVLTGDDGTAQSTGEQVTQGSETMAGSMSYRGAFSDDDETVGGAAVLAMLVAYGTTAPSVVAQALAEWPQFRGLTAGAVADDPALPDTWSTTDNVAWAVEIPGLGWSSPVVAGDHVFVTAAISAGEELQPVPGLYDPGDEFGKQRSTAEHRWMVYDVSFATGRIRWARELEALAPSELKHIKNSFASETPVTDGRRVYAYFGAIGLVAALNLSGETVWTAEVGAFNGGQEFGSAASPVLHGGRLYLVNDNTTQSFLAAFDTATGEQVWRVDRDETENWSTPFIWENDVRTEIVTTGRRKIRSYDLDGNQLWELGGMTPERRPDAVRRPRPAVSELRLSRRVPAAGLCRPPRRGGRHLARRGRDGQRAHRLVPAVARHLQHFRARLRRPLLHAARPAVSCCVTTPGRARKSTGAVESLPVTGSPPRRGATTGRSSP